MLILTYFSNIRHNLREFVFVFLFLLEKRHSRAIEGNSVDDAALLIEPHTINTPT